MAATIVYGKYFKLVKRETPPGTAQFEELTPMEGGYEHISNSRLGEIMEFACKYGIPKDSWPDYRELEMSKYIHVDDLLERNEEFRRCLEAIPCDVIEQNGDFHRVCRLLERDIKFFII
jgi:hypothetical protein